MRREVVLLGLALVSACQRKHAPPSAAREPSAAVTEAAPRWTPPPPPEPAIELSPAPASAPREERESTVWALILGKKPAARLPEVATDPGKSLDPGRRERLAPKKGARPCTCNPGDPLCDCSE